MLKRLPKVDIFLETSKGFLAIELKSTLVWERKYSKGLYRLREEIGKGKVKCLGVFLGERPVHMDGINIYPAMQFLKLLWENEVIRSFFAKNDQKNIIKVLTS